MNKEVIKPNWYNGQIISTETGNFWVGKRDGGIEVWKNNKLLYASAEQQPEPCKTSEEYHICGDLWKTCSFLKSQADEITAGKSLLRIKAQKARKRLWLETDSLKAEIKRLKEALEREGK